MNRNKVGGTGFQPVGCTLLALVSALVAVAMAAAAPTEIPGVPGATRIVFDMPVDGQATVALYTSSGRLVRILGQLLELKGGPHVIRWDGMDLWGQMVPQGTELVVKVFSNPGIKAYYEFTVGHANPTPWITKPVGEGLNMRTGGWMGDHSPPQSAVAVGDKVFFGCLVAEHGHALIACDTEGNKLWGINGLEGWSGPSHMATDGKFIYCDAKGKDIWRVDASTYERKRIVQTGDAKVVGLAARGGQVLAMLRKGEETSVEIYTPDGGHGGALGKRTFTAMAADANGILFVTDGKRLLRVSQSPQAPDMQFTVVNEADLKKPVSIAVSADRIAVGDDELYAVVVFDRQGKKLFTIGGKGPRKAGPWDPAVIQRPTGVAFDRNGKIWVTENLYVPKRITRWSADGKLEKQFFGPAEYGGGGYLDKNLKRFYYRSMDYALDFAKGTWELTALNDHISNPYTVAPQAGGFTFTTIGRPIYHNGHRYLVSNPERGDGFQVTLLDDGMTAWRPCAAMGQALPSTRNKQTNERVYSLPTFFKKDFWRDHWQKKMDAGELKDKSFIWCDHNGDGRQQIEEVELFEDKPYGANPFGAPFFGNWVGYDLTLWTNKVRLAPSRFTDSAVPIYESRAMQPFHYAKLAPVYRKSFTVRTGATANAKPDYGGTSIVTTDGNLVLEGQPYVVMPDLSIKGGSPTFHAKPKNGQSWDRRELPTDYIPPIPGRIMDQPLHFVGSAMTKSPAGEVAMLNGNNGQWFIFSCRDGVLLGEIFTGRDGSWSTGLEPKRGMDVTGRKQDWECFFGHFTGADDGKYYVVAGHTFHAISRIEGLDHYRLTEAAMKVMPADYAANKVLRPQLVAASAVKPEAEKKLTIHPLARRTTNHKLDGDLADWGDPAAFTALGDPALKLSFAAAWDKDGLYIAYRGTSDLGNASESINTLFKTGFSMDFQYRGNPQTNAGSVVVGDRRIVLAPYQKQWLAVLYDYLDPATPPEKHVEFSSPLITTRVARVAPLSKAKVAVKQGPTVELPGQRAMPQWSAEVFLPWEELGLRPDPKTPLRCDFGILTPDSGGVRVEKRTYWSNRATDMVADLGMEAQINPAAWGTATFAQ